MRFRTLSTALLALALAAGTTHAQSRTKPKRPASNRNDDVADESESTDE